MTKRLAIVLAALALTGCHSLGPDSIRGSHALYNQAIATSLNEQFLLNLVRLRYRDTPYFLEIRGVTVTRGPDGSRFDWHQTPAGRLFRVHYSRHRPEEAFLAVPYRGYWFYVADDDLDSKASFMLMSQLFSLNAGTVRSVSPMLTIPVSR